jgi:hypothetical protein
MFSGPSDTSKTKSSNSVEYRFDFQKRKWALVRPPWYSRLADWIYWIRRGRFEDAMDRLADEHWRALKEFYSTNVMMDLNPKGTGKIRMRAWKKL